MITITDVLKRAGTHMSEHPNYRYGQAIWQSANELIPCIVTAVDPYNDDELVGEYLMGLMKQLNDEPSSIPIAKWGRDF